MFRLEVVHRVEVGDVYTPTIGLWAIIAVLLDVHPKETDINSVLLLKDEQGLGSVRVFCGMTIKQKKVNRAFAAKGSES